MYPDATEVSDAMDVFLERSLPTLEGMDLSLTNKVASLAARIAPNWLFENLSRLAVNQMLAHKKHFCCPLTTVSTIIKTEVVVLASNYPELCSHAWPANNQKPDTTFEQKWAFPV